MLFDSGSFHNLTFSDVVEKVEPLGDEVPIYTGGSPFVSSATATVRLSNLPTKRAGAMTLPRFEAFVIERPLEKNECAQGTWLHPRGANRAPARCHREVTLESTASVCRNGVGNRH